MTTLLQTLANTVSFLQSDTIKHWDFSVTTLLPCARDGHNSNIKQKIFATRNSYRYTPFSNKLRDWTSPGYEAKASGWLQSAVTTADMLCPASHTFAYWTSWSSVTNLTFFIVECGIARFLCAMRVFDIRASPYPLGYLCVKFRFCGDVHC